MNKYKQTKVDGKHMLAHRYIYQEYIKRPLLRGELIHHKNGDKSDNRIENLEIMTPKEHSVHHLQKYPLTKVCEVCGAEFVPHPTKRKRAKTCSNECRYKLISLKLRQPEKPNSLYREGAYPCQKAKRLSLK
jgi:hypothetical protein